MNLEILRALNELVDSLAETFNEAEINKLLHAMVTRPDEIDDLINKNSKEEAI